MLPESNETGTNRTLLVFRFSAMGDVAMVAVVLREIIQQHPHLTLVVVSRATFKPFFADIPGVVFHPFYPHGTHRGIRGIYRLFTELLHYTPHGVADLHFNIRSRALTTLFRLNGIPVRQLDKGRAEKKALTRARHKIKKPLRPMVERYADVFRALDYPLVLSHGLQSRPLPLPDRAKSLLDGGSPTKVGIAPFARHAPKVYPLSRMEHVVDYLDRQGNTVLIFGNGPEEQQVAQSWQERFNNVHSLVGWGTLSDELAVISHLDVMLTMDSANMHMASLMGVRVLSVWGPTHPYAGFLGYGQQLGDCIQVEHPARPNSVYGQKPCLCDGVDSMELISPEMIIGKLKSIGL